MPKHKSRRNEMRAVFVRTFYSRRRLRAGRNGEQRPRWFIFFIRFLSVCSLNASVTRFGRRTQEKVLKCIDHSEERKKEITWKCNTYTNTSTNTQNSERSIKKTNGAELLCMYVFCEQCKGRIEIRSRFFLSFEIYVGRTAAP